jgi:hypothetical protein
MTPLREDPALVALFGIGKTPGHDCRSPGAHRAGLSEATMGGQVMKSRSFVVTEVRERTGTDLAWV